MTNTQGVNAAIVGLGRWGQNLVTAATTDTDSLLRFTRGTTRTPAKATRLIEDTGLQIDENFETLLRNAEIEAVVLATPHSQHAQQICDAAYAGKHVFVEKPLALTTDDAKRAINACQENSVVLAVGFNRRFMPAYRAMCDFHHSGKLGTPLHIEGNFSGSFGYHYTEEMWRGTASENPAGGMAAMGIHMLDAMIHLLGPVKRVTTLSKRRVLTTTIDDTTTVQLEFENGATGCLTSLMVTPSHWRLQLFGSEGWVALPDQEHLELRLLDDANISKETFPTLDSLALELNAFASSIRNGTRFPVSMSEALAGVAAMQAISISADQNGSTTNVENLTDAEKNKFDA